MNRFNKITLPTVDDLTGWEDITEEDESILTIFLRNGKKITPKEQFKAYFNGRTLRKNVELSRINFLITFNDETSFYLLQKIKNSKKEIMQLTDLSIWYDGTETISINNFKNNSSVGVITATGSRGGTTDNNSLMKAAELQQFFNIKQEYAIPANNLNQSISLDDSKTTTDGGGNSDTTNTTKISNLSNDIINSLNLMIPGLKHKFWHRFEHLFM